MATATVLAASAWAQGSADAGADPAAQINRFNDPFFAFTAAVADCPEPLGPRITAAEQAAQAHQRVEKGNSCFLAGRCERPSAFAYDADIAAALKQAVQPTNFYAHSPLVHSSLWATVRARAVTIDGCVAGDVPTGFDHAFITRSLEVFARSLPHVEQVVVRVRTGEQARAGQPVPYPIMGRGH